MKTRAITGFFFVTVLIASVLLGPYTFSAFFLFTSVLSLDEFYRLVRAGGIKVQRFAGLAAGTLLSTWIIFHYLYIGLPVPVWVIVPFIILLFIAELYRKNERPFDNIAYGLTGLVFTVAPFCFLYASAFFGAFYDFHIPLGFLFLLWASDTGAYLSGLKLGRTKLFERHSPKKTWEGFFGGMILSLLVAFILGIFWTSLNSYEWAGMSLIIVVFGTLGDLTESMLKRSLDVKDSGSLLPGHGGLLDRFDGLLLSAPLVFVYLFFILS